MDLTMSIASLSTQISQSNLSQAVDIAMMKKTMETQEASAENLIQMLSSAVPPSFGHKIDVRA
jgi:hypothetical protein